ncbi:transcription termination factor Rho [Lachnospiraceae bacterium JLR.KK009]|nr:transcription termination factor Rho [Lachnospiraceae bacterium A2]MCI8706321.1 transcription termination factor Rho [Lachnospiraceae bacterium]MCI8883319.1 transcription termination factor Rho [Lachnospiraceae bacterium]
MREKYESLSVSVLKEVAKARGLKHLSGLKKGELVELMLKEDAKAAGVENGEKEEGKAAEPERKASGRNAEEKEDTRQPERRASGRNPEGREEMKQPERRGSSRSTEEREEVRQPERRGSSRNTEEREEVRQPERRFAGRNAEERQNNQDRRSSRIITADGIEIDNPELDSGVSAHGILEVMPDGYGFIRCENYLPGDQDVYVSPSQIRKFGLKTGDIIHGNTRVKTQQEKFSALLYIKSINGNHPSEILRRPNFEDLTPIFPNERIRLETDRSASAMRIMDVVSPIGKGQRGMIVSPPKAGKTTLLKQVAKAVTRNNPDMHLIILLIDERPEEVTDIKEAIEGKHVEVIYSTFDELPEHHKRVSEMVIERARRLVEHGKDVMILLDSITRLARAYNLIVPPSGRTLSGGIDPAALHMPKRFFGAARNMREGGSITILATALVDTGSRMDDVIYEEFKGTGNMEIILDRKLSERRVFPAVDITKSGTRREDLLLSREEQEAVEIMRRAINGMKADEAVESILNLFVRTNNNREFCQMIKKTKLL